MFIIAGSMKSLNYEKALESLAWVKDSSRSFVTFVGVAELLGGIGLILPQALDIYQLLTPIAAVGLAIIMLLAILYHLKRKESAITMNIVLLIIAVVVAIGRF